MKRRRKRRKPSLQPQVILVGNSGKICRDNRLCRLRITKKYKNFLMEQEKEKNAKISEMSKLVEQYENLSCLIHNLNRENANNSNTDLLQELKDMQTKYRERLLHLESTFMDTIPDALNRSVREILNRCSKFNKQKKANKEKTELKSSPISHGNANLRGVNKMSPTDLMNSINKSDQKANTSSVSEMKSNESSSLVTRNSWSGCYKSQIFVRKSNSQLQAINIDLFSVGNNLYDVLAHELDDDVTNYNLIFGAKEVDKEKTLFEQEIYHGSTVDLILPLYGGMPGMGKKKKRQKKTKKKKEATLKEDREHLIEETSKADKVPEPWTDPEVQRWFEETNEIVEIDLHLVSPLKTLDDNQVNMLAKEDWIKMFPIYGHILFNLWQKDQQKSAKTDERTLLKPLDKETEQVYDSSNDPDDSRPNVESQGQDTSNSSRKVLFGEVGALDGIGESFLLEDFENDDKSPIPHFGSVITVTGVCLSTPHVQGNVATLFIQDEAQGAFHNKIKIVIAGCKSNKNEINILLKDVNTNMHVGVKGRVEKLGKKDDVVNKDGCKMLKFKLVIDSDNHALFSVETKPPKLIRQLSHSWWPLQAGFENAYELNLKVGDFIVDNDLERVYCDHDTSDEIILQYVVAFKNSFDGEIFVGVKKNGEITGMEASNGEIKKWCERISKAIGNLLPESNVGADICRDIQETNRHRNRCFVCALPLCDDSCRSIGWIHVPKGEAKVYFTKASDVHVFKRVEAKNKRITNYKHLFYDLDSLASRQIEPAFVEEYDEEDDEQNKEKCKSQDEYHVLKEVKHENQHHELKMIFGDNPVKTILKRYLAPYACGFLNLNEGDGGSIFFGIEEDKQSKMGHIVGIVLSMEERTALVETTVKTLRNFYPSVSRSQFHIKFHSVRVPSGFVVRDKGGNSYAMITGPSDEIGKKWSKFIQNKLPGCCSAVIPIRSQRFCVVATKQTSDGGNLTELVEQFVKSNSKFELQIISETELNTILKNFCVVELNVSRSLYPIHMIKTIDTYVFSKDKEKGLSKLSLEDLMYRFKLDSTCEFDIDKFLEHVKNFDSAGNSYILVASPFYFPENERDLYGLVIPKWTLTIDLDQEPKQTGHLYQLFQTLNDRYQTERERFLKTIQDSKLDLNPDHAVCWLAARGYREDENSLSEESHAKWNKTHRSRVRELLNKGLENSVKPNCLNVVVLWDEGHQALVESLRTILEDVISFNGGDSTVVSFVCATAKARSNITRKIIEPFQEDNWDTISEDRVYVAPPYVLARYLSLKLPSPYRPEDDYQVPHKKYFPYAGSQIIPQILPKRLRQNLSGYIEVMYIKKGRKPDEQTLNQERRNFFSGSAITNDGLHGNIGIRRTKMDELEKYFKTLACNKKSHVSLIFVRVDRGAGSTTMCLQFLYEQYRFYPCAQLIEIKNGLVSHIEEMNKKTKLPLILFVDEDIAYSQEFLDFKKKVERRNVNVIFILIEPSEVTESLPTRKVRTKNARDSSLYGPSPYKVVQLQQTLDNDEMEQLVKVLTVLAKGKKNKLLKFEDSARKDKKKRRTFAYFSLLAFGSEFKGLKQYVEFRLNRADEREQSILAFLSLTRVYTDYSLPANALVHFLNKSNVGLILEEELEDKYLQELLCPRADDSDSRRILFYDVAKEILKQLSLKQLSATSSGAKSGGDSYWNYIKYVSVTMAKHVLSKYITTRKIDRLTRKLFVTSEHESEQFSQLIRTMRVASPDTARDTLKELVKVFDEKERHSSIRAHLRAHLAKYYMIEYKDFVEAKELIEAAIREQEQDSFLHHIHGDIIRLYVLDLLDKMKKKEDMEIMLSYATQSSKCFEFVRSKRPRMSHGYISDAMVRITVMQAGIKLMGGKNVSFVDYLIERINEIKESDDEDISPNSRYLLSLISDTHAYLDERYIDFERKEKWKETFLSCIGKLTNLTRLCDKIKEEKDCSSFIGCSTWLHEILVQTQILYNALESENKVLSPEKIETRLKKMEEYASHSKFEDRFMKFWIRYSRQRLSVPTLEEVKRRVEEWSNKMKKKRVASPQAEFYNFVMDVLIALKDPSDREKMDKAERLTKHQQYKRYNKKEDFIFPPEWLHPKNGRHIESIDCLLHHDDLVKGTNIFFKSDKRKRIEDSLVEKNITKWEGTITEIRSERQGTITFKGRLPVRFVPLNTQPSMPSLGDTVTFCLSFDGYGLSAWRVVLIAGTQPSDLSDIVSRDDDSSSEHSEQEDVEKENFLVAPSLCSIHIQEPDEKHGLDEQKDQRSQAGAVLEKCSKMHWDEYNEKRMQGVVSSTNSEMGFGFIENADVKDKLFFHVSLLRVPVKKLKGNIVKDMLLDFKVEKSTERTRAADIRVLEDENLRKSMLKKLRNITINEEGGCFHVPVASAFLLFPPNAVEEEVTLKCSRVKHKECEVKPRDGEVFVSRILKVKPEGLTFKRPVTVFLSHSLYEDQDFMDFYELFVKNLSQTGWQELKTERISSIKDVPERISNKKILEDYLPFLKATIYETCTLVAATRARFNQILLSTNESYTFSKQYGDNTELKITFPPGVTERKLNLIVQLFPAAAVLNRAIRSNKNLVCVPIIKVSGQKTPFLKAVDIELIHSHSDVDSIEEEFLPVGKRVKFTTEYGLLLRSHKETEFRSDWRALNESNDVYIERSRKDQLKFSFSVEHFCYILSFVRKIFDSILPLWSSSMVEVNNPACHSAIALAVHKTDSSPKTLHAVLAPMAAFNDLKTSWNVEDIKIRKFDKPIKSKEPIYFCVPLSDRDGVRDSHHLPLKDHTLRFDPDPLFPLVLDNNADDNLNGKYMHFLTDRDCNNGENHSTQGDCHAKAPIHISETRSVQASKERHELVLGSESPQESSEGWKWEENSKVHREKLITLQEYGKSRPHEIKEVNGVRFCCSPEFFIGSGSDGTGVYVGLGKDGYERAVKRLLRYSGDSFAEQEKKVLNEINTIHSNNVVRYWFLDDKSDKDWLFLILDLCEETLREFVDRTSLNNLTTNAPHIIQQVLKGLADLHREPKPILHRDLKPSNILRDIHGNWLLADFGISRILTAGSSTYRSGQSGTDDWRAVESHHSNATTDGGKVRYKKESDIQVAGMVAFYIVTKGEHPFGEKADRLRNLMDGKPVSLATLTDSVLKDLLAWMLSHDTKDRPSAEKALKHPYLQPAKQQFDMLCKVGNQPEIKTCDTKSEVVRKLNSVPKKWKSLVRPDVLKYLSTDPLKGKTFHYKPSWTDCLRLIRNIKEHWHDRPRPQPEIFYLVGDPQEYFLKLFPNLPVEVHRIIRSCDWKERVELKEYFI